MGTFHWSFQPPKESRLEVKNPIFDSFSEHLCFYGFLIRFLVAEIPEFGDFNRM
jgi:hypothetical protein